MANPSLSTKQQRSIETLIRKWRSKLSWDLLVKSIDTQLNIRTTRQTLSSYLSIKNEFKQKKDELRGISPVLIKEVSLSDIKLHERLKEREAKILILENQLAEQLAFITRIFDNASEINNLRLEDLIKERH